jgi:hypothetical protein
MDNQIQIGSQVYYGGISNPHSQPGLGFGHGHYNLDTGYNRPPIGGDSVINALGWTAIMQPGGHPSNKHNIDIGGPRP